jgi:carboxypeptidase Q
MKAFIGIILIVSYLPMAGQLCIDVLKRIKKESDSNSKVMKVISRLSDVYDPRLMGTPNYYVSLLWIEEKLKQYGITKIEKQSFDDGHLGWELLNFKMELAQPFYSHINAYPLAYTSSTQGEVIADPSTPEKNLKKDGKGHAGLTEKIVK